MNTAIAKTLTIIFLTILLMFGTILYIFSVPLNPEDFYVTVKVISADPRTGTYRVNVTACYKQEIPLPLENLTVILANKTIEFGDIESCKSKVIMLTTDEINYIIQEHEFKYSFVIGGLYTVTGTYKLEG